MAKRTKSRNNIQEFIETMEVDDELHQTFSGDVDYSEDRVLIEDLGEEEYDFSDFTFDDVEETEEEFIAPSDEPEEESEEELEEYTEDEIQALLARLDLADSDKNKFSFDALMPKKKKKTGIQIQRKEKKVHHFLVLRDMVRMTPSVCKRPDCKFDSAKALGWKKRGWDDVPVGKQSLVLRILEEHMQSEHIFTDDSIIDLSDMPQAWLNAM